MISDNVYVSRAEPGRPPAPYGVGPSVTTTRPTAPVRVL